MEFIEAVEKVDTIFTNSLGSIDVLDSNRFEDLKTFDKVPRINKETFEHIKKLAIDRIENNFDSLYARNKNWQDRLNKNGSLNFRVYSNTYDIGNAIQLLPSRPNRITGKITNPFTLIIREPLESAYKTSYNDGSTLYTESIETVDLILFID